jgi:hydrogenase expression/formation protein HypE
MNNNSSEPLFIQGPVCPLPYTQNEKIVIGHGSGGTMTRDLIQNVFQSHLGNAYLAEGNDAARIIYDLPEVQLAISTDTHVVKPIFYPGGDIGRLAVCGTVNDVAMLGAEPQFLTAGFIIEEGFSIAALNEIIKSMAEACLESGVKVVAGDTKVVEKGNADGIFINTTGFGIIPKHLLIGGQYAKPGDAVLLSGTIGDHGIAIVQARGDLGFESEIKSDVAPLNHMIKSLVDEIPEIHVLRDPTRGGLATTLKEIAMQSQISIRVNEVQVPIKPDVQIACEMLGFDPLYIANEGKVIIILPDKYTDQALEIIKNSPYGVNATRIGTVFPEHPGTVLLETPYGTTRILDLLAGEILPRIC